MKGLLHIFTCVFYNIATHWLYLGVYIYEMGVIWDSYNSLHIGTHIYGKTNYSGSITTTSCFFVVPSQLPLLVLRERHDKFGFL